jgi:hypothetical protein
MSKNAGKELMISFRCDEEVQRELRERHSRLVHRIERMASIVISSRPLVIEKSKPPSFSEYMRHLSAVATRRLDHDLYFQSNVRQALAVMVEPSNSDVARVLLSCHAVPNWTGWINMVAFQRGLKMQKAAVRGHLRSKQHAAA